MPCAPWNTEDIGGRICEYVRTGNVPLLKSLYESGFLKVSDRFDTTGRYRHTYHYDTTTLMYFAAQFGCEQNYKEIIDLFLQYGDTPNGYAKDNESYDCYISPMTEAMMYGNYDIAAYLESKGGTCDVEELDMGSNDGWEQKLVDARKKLMST